MDLQASFELSLRDLLVDVCGHRKVTQLTENPKRHQRRYHHFVFAGLGSEGRARDKHPDIVDAARCRNLAAALEGLCAPRLVLHGESAPRLPVDVTSNRELS